jgi:hypothetical protein
LSLFRPHSSEQKALSAVQGASPNLGEGLKAANAIDHDPAVVPQNQDSALSEPHLFQGLHFSSKLVWTGFMDITFQNETADWVRIQNVTPDFGNQACALWRLQVPQADWRSLDIMMKSSEPNWQNSFPNRIYWPKALSFHWDCLQKSE